VTAVLHYVIVGNGPAANQAAATLRAGTDDARVSMLGREPVGFYRPDLLPGFIAGEIHEEELYVAPSSSYKARGIKLRLGQQVTGVRLTQKEILLDHRECVSFDGLIIAVGGKPRIPEPLEAYRDLMLTLKTLRDARAWREKLAGVDSVLIIGGDMTSLAFTKALLTMGKQVRFVLDSDCFWPVRLTDAIREAVVERLEGRGVEVLRSTKLKSLTRISEDRIAAETDAGSIEAGAVGAFFGLVPDVDFLVGSGLDIERGILVDECLQTPFADVYAAGDCAQVYHPELRDYWVSVGYRNAKNLGEIAALNLLGGKVEAKAAPESIFRVEGIDINTSWWTEF
jgi:NADPH-dependent 2,4-dienoyl-CoA reductase/sulfur reductase-like enzyme